MAYTPSWENNNQPVNRTVTTPSVRPAVSTPTPVTKPKKKWGFWDILTPGKEVVKLALGGAMKSAKSFGESELFKLTPEYKTFKKYVDEGKITKEEAKKVSPSLYKTKTQRFGELAEGALDLATLGLGSATAKGSYQLGKLSLKSLAKQGAKTGAKLGGAYGTATGLQREGATAGSILKSMATGGAIGLAAGGILTPALGKLSSKLNKPDDIGKATSDLFDDFPQKDYALKEIKASTTDIGKQYAGLAIKKGKYLDPKIADARIRDLATKLDDMLPGTKASDEILKAFPKLNKVNSLDDLEKAGTAVFEKYSRKQPVQELLDALRGSAKIARSKQQEIYSVEKAKRVGEYMNRIKSANTQGEVRSAMAALSGEYTKADFKAIKMPQESVDAIFKMAAQSDAISGFEKAPATTGLEKIFTGKIPTTSEITILEKVFGQELTSELLAKQTLLQKTGKTLAEVLNTPRALLTPGDLSASFRQAAFMVGRPKQFVPAFTKQLKMFASEDVFKQVMEEIRTRPTAGIMKQSGLALTDIGGPISNREEAFMSSWTNKIPLVRASNRAYTGFLNKLRADVFDDLLNKAVEKGYKKTDPVLTESLAKMINTGTGRGSIKALEQAMVPLNEIAFSPRLALSRVQTLNPYYYYKLQPFVRKEALKTLFTDAAIAGTVLALAKGAGADVVTDSRNADFGKIKIGNTRIDILGGHQQYIRLASQLLTNKIVSSTTGKEITLGEGYKPLTRTGILGRFFESKTAPVASFAIGLLRGTNVLGEKFEVPKELATRLYPMIIQDTVDAVKEWGAKGAGFGGLGVLGFGVQTYSPRDIKNIPKDVIKDFGQTNEVEQALDDSKYFIPAIEPILTRTVKGTETKLKLKGEESKTFEKEMGKATLQGIIDATKTEGWANMSVDEKNSIMKTKISNAKTKVRDAWKDKLMGAINSKTSETTNIPKTYKPSWE